MELHIFLLGICFSLNSLMAYFFFRTRHQRAPYRLAYGWVNLIYALQLLTDVVMINHLSDPYYLNIKIAKDMLGLPFGAMEMVCLFFQNTARLSWSKRWRSLIQQEVVFILFLIAALTTCWHLLPYLMLAYAFCYVTVVHLYCHNRLKSYEGILQSASIIHNRSLRWVHIVHLLYLIFFVVYFMVFYFAVLPFWLFYLTSMAVWMIHSNYINRQRPLNIYTLEKSRQRMEQDMLQTMSSINEVTSDLNKRAEKLKEKADMRSYIETFVLQHPQFVSKIRALTPTRLTERDLYLCMLISDGKKTMALARSLGIDPKSAEVARSRLRKKLQLQSDQSLNQLIASCL